MKLSRSKSDINPSLLNRLMLNFHSKDEAKHSESEKVLETDYVFSPDCSYEVNLLMFKWSMNPFNLFGLFKIVFLLFPHSLYDIIHFLKLWWRVLIQVKRLNVADISLVSVIFGLQLHLLALFKLQKGRTAWSFVISTIIILSWIFAEWIKMAATTLF